MNDLVVLPIVIWVDYYYQLVESYLIRHPEDEERINNNRDDIIQVIDCIVWNEVTKDIKYKVDRWDDEYYINRLFDDYRPMKVGLNANIYKDTASTEYYQEVIDRLAAKIEEFLRANIDYPQWEVVTLYNEGRGRVLHIYGDWRAKEWCKRNGVIYEYD